MPTPELDDAELAMVVAALKEKLDREWQYRMASRLAPLVSALAKLDPASVPSLPRHARRCRKPPARAAPEHAGSAAQKRCNA